MWKNGWRRICPTETPCLLLSFSEIRQDMISIKSVSIFEMSGGSTVASQNSAGNPPLKLSAANAAAYLAGVDNGAGSRLKQPPGSGYPQGWCLYARVLQDRGSEVAPMILSSQNERSCSRPDFR